MTERVAAPGLRRLPPYWHEYKTRAKTRWYGRQILEVFTTEFRDRTREYYIWAIHQGLCTVNGHSVQPTYILQNNDFLVNRVHKHEPAVTNAPVRILFRDDAMGRIVVVKPGSIPVHATGRYHHHTLVEMVKQQAQLSNLYTSNRLDRLTSGIMVCSTTKEAACELGNDFNAGLVNKAYVCRVAGRFPDGIIDCREPILSVDRQSGLNIVHPKGKECRTLFQCLSYDPTADSSVLVCRPITGRTHQIRVHAQWLGHPISNDPLYHHPVWSTVDRDILATAQPRHYERVGGGSGNVEVERVLTALKGTRDDAEGWSRWRDQEFFGALNRQLGYEDVPVPGPNGQRTPPPPPGEDMPPGTATCDTCYIPLLPDPAPQDMYIYLHAIKYWTDTWVFEDELPWWARSSAKASASLPPLALIAHHTGDDALGLGKGGAQRRLDTQLQPAMQLASLPLAPRPDACAHDESLQVFVEVTRGLEDAAQREMLQHLGADPSASSCLTSALHSGIIQVDAPLHAQVVARYEACQLPIATGVYYAMGHMSLPRDMLDALFDQRVEVLGKKGAQKSQPTLAEQALLQWLTQQWHAHQAQRDKALDLWMKRASRRTRTWCVVVDRSSYVLPSLSTQALETHLASLVTGWLDSHSWTPASTRAEADMVIKCTMAPRFGAQSPLQLGPRAHKGNPPGTCFFQLHVPGGPCNVAADALRTSLARSRAHAVCALLPLGDGTCVGTLHSKDSHLADALRAMLHARGRMTAQVPYGSTSAHALHGAVVELPESARDEPHALLFDHFVTELECLSHALAPGKFALVLTSETKTCMRALRELENRARREHSPYVLRMDTGVTLGDAWPAEHAATFKDAQQEASLRSGGTWRALAHHRSFLACVAQAPLYKT